MANVYKLLEERYARVVDVDGVRYLVTVAVTDRDGISPLAALTATADGQLQLDQDGRVQLPVKDLLAWQDILADTVGAAAGSLTEDLGDLDESRIGRGWAEDEDQQLKHMWARREQDAVRAIAKALTRRTGGIRSRLRYLGLLPEGPWPEPGSGSSGGGPPDDDAPPHGSGGPRQYPTEQPAGLAADTPPPRQAGTGAPPGDNPEGPAGGRSSFRG